MKRCFSLLAVLVFSTISTPSAWSDDPINCPWLQGSYQAQIASTRVRLDIVQTGCESITLSYRYPQAVVTKTHQLTSMSLVSIDDGDTFQTESAKFEKIVLADKFSVDALRVDRTEKSRLNEETLSATTHYYIESGKFGRNLVERRDWINSQGERLRRVYIGYGSIKE